MQENVQALHRVFSNRVDECAGILPVEMGGQLLCAVAELPLQPLPVVFVVAKIDEQAQFLLADEGQAVFDNRLEQLALCSRPAHSNHEAARLPAAHSPQPGGTVRFDVLDQLMVDMMAGVMDCIRRQRFHDLSGFVETAHGAEAVITGGRLYSVFGPLGELEGHGPVVEHHIDHICHTAGNCAHTVPHVGGQNRHVLRKGLMQITEELAHLVVFYIGLEKTPGPSDDPAVQQP